MDFDSNSIQIPEELNEITPIVTCTIEGILEVDDLRELADPALAGTEPPAALEVEDPGNLKKIREKHHSVARLIAGGMTQRMVAQLSGYNESYVSVLLNNPAMTELIEMYRIQQGAATAVITEKLKTVGLKAVEKLEEQMDEGKLSNQELLAAAKLGLDRGGHGPQSKHHVVNENHSIDHTRLAELNNKARANSREFIVPVSEVRQAVLPAPEDDNESA